MRVHFGCACARLFNSSWSAVDFGQLCHKFWSVDVSRRIVVIFYVPIFLCKNGPRRPLLFGCSLMVDRSEKVMLFHRSFFPRRWLLEEAALSPEEGSVHYVGVLESTF